MNGTTTVFSLPAPRVLGLPLKPRTLWTIVGVTAIPLWATWPLLAVLSTSVPLFQFLAIIFAVGAVFLFCLPKASPQATETSDNRSWLTAWLPAFMVALGLLVSDVFFIWALGYIPPAQANLILYLWPLMVVLLGVMLGLFALKANHLMSVAIGLAGAALVIGAEVTTIDWLGVALAAAGGLAWAIFVVFRLWQGENAPDALMRGFALSAIIALGLHLLFETTMIPPAGTLICSVLVGIIPLALGNLAWDYGIRRGDRVLLSVLAYATPLVSALILIAAGFASPTRGLLAGGIMIVVAGVISAR
ncbi:DMT family transporter [Taklimakanibacter lacteus]|uniref:DMT family transporter n=1 Tax=Taklimakanibacter lacteus TaxID=2268456 RepID=UPI000E665F61